MSEEVQTTAGQNRDLDVSWDAMGPGYGAGWMARIGGTPKTTVESIPETGFLKHANWLRGWMGANAVQVKFVLIKENPNHDDRGRFAEGSGSENSKEENDNALDEARSESKRWIRSLSIEERDSLTDYTLDSSINDRLRVGSADGRHDEAMIGNIDNALESASLPARTTMFRGLSREVSEGDEFEDKGYMSLSASKTISEEFSERGGGGSILHITLPKGFPAAYLGSLSTSYASEGEFLCPRGITIRVGRNLGSNHFSAEIVDAHG